MAKHENAVTEDMVESWRKNHSVSYGEPIKLTLQNGIRTSDSGGFELADVFMAYQENVGPLKVPFVLQDEKGCFILKVKYGLLRVFNNRYYKQYEKDGKTEDISKEDYKYWKAEARALWGYINVWGKFVPGLLRPELPISTAKE
ncbi:MAG: hypothetical protein FWF88_06495 [Peptococcaceae bacterium]|jgi:hypothetical protein|nr:hypothetical protein [Peptococcaceae bacterium]